MGGSRRASLFYSRKSFWATLFTLFIGEDDKYVNLRRTFSNPSLLSLFASSLQFEGLFTFTHPGDPFMMLFYVIQHDAKSGASSSLADTMPHAQSCIVKCRINVHSQIGPAVSKEERHVLKWG